MLAAVVLVPLPMLILPTPAYACECANVSTSRSLRTADAVFRGRVTEKDLVGRKPERRVDLRFEVDAVFKGTVYREQVVATAPDTAACGLDPEVGTTWIIFAIDGVEGIGNDAVSRLVTGSCSGSLPTSNPPLTIGRPEPPLDGASDRAERSTGADRQLTRGLAVGGIAVMFVGALAVMGLVFLWRPGRRR